MKKTARKPERGSWRTTVRQLWDFLRGEKAPEPFSPDVDDAEAGSFPRPESPQDIPVPEVQFPVWTENGGYGEEANAWRSSGEKSGSLPKSESPAGAAFSNPAPAPAQEDEMRPLVPEASLWPAGERIPREGGKNRLDQAPKSDVRPPQPVGPSATPSPNTDGWARLAGDLAAFSEELMELDVPDNADLHAAVQYALNRIDAILEKTGVQPIDGERTYSPLRHVPVPPGPVRKGTPIARTLRKGWCIGGKVLRKARIETDAMPAAEATGIVP